MVVDRIDGRDGAGGAAMTTQSNSAEMVRAYVQRAVVLLESADKVRAEMGELKTAAKGNGLDPAILMRVARLKHDDKKRAKEVEAREIEKLYADAAGVQLGLGL